MTEAPETLDQLVRHATSANPTKQALLDAPNRESFFSGQPASLTWNELSRAIDTIAASVSNAGIAHGDVVAIQLPNVVELPIAILACARIGAVATPFPIQHREHELRYGLRASKAKVMISGARPDRDDVLSTTKAVCDEYGTKLLTFGPDTIDGAQPISVSGDSVDTLTSGGPSDLATICWTSGTTGVPKGVPRTNTMWTAVSNFQVTELGLGPDDRILCPRGST